MMSQKEKNVTFIKKTSLKGDIPMPTKKQILDSKLAQFNSKYNLNLSESSLSVRVANTTPEEIKHSYKQVSTSVLLEYLSNAMKMRENASYDFTQFSIPDFAAEFEDVMKAKANLQGISGRTDYEGVKLNELFDNMKEEATKYSYPLAELWKQSFISGSLNLPTMKAVTRDAASVLLGDNADAPDNMSQRSKNALQSLVAAKQTMDLIREKRGFSWRLRHPILNYREKKYLKERLEAVSEYLYTSVSEDRNFKTAIYDKDYILTFNIYVALWPVLDSYFTDLKYFLTHYDFFIANHHLPLVK